MALVKQKEWNRFWRTGIVGAAGTLLDGGVLLYLVQSLRLPLMFANTLSYGLGILLTFTLNQLWVYPETAKQPTLQRFGRFGVVNMVGLTLNTIILMIIEVLLLPKAGATVLAKIAATGVSFIWNFSANRVWTFGDVDEERSHA